MRSAIRKKIYDYRHLYLLLLPGILFYIIIAYFPMYGVILAFKKFHFMKGITYSPWVGMDNFKQMLDMPDFWKAFYNTIIIAFQRLIIEFPIPIMIALLLNEVRNKKLKKAYQTVYTFPHFLSWVIIGSIMINFFGSEGMFNQLLTHLNLDKINVLTDTSKFRGVLYGTNIWKEMGWGTIIYLAAIAGIDPHLYEAATVDGANRWHRIRFITLPALRSTIVVLFILAVGATMSSGGGGFNQIFNMYNAAVYEVADIIDTYIYRMTFVQGTGFGFVTAVGLFKSVINAIMLVSANYVVKLLGEDGII